VTGNRSPASCSLFPASKSTRLPADTLTAIHETQGVISAAITFQYSDDESET